MPVADAARVSPHAPAALRLLRAGVAVPATAAVALQALRRPEELARPAVLAWVAVLLAVELVPMPDWGGPGLSVAFAVQVAVAMLYEPLLAGTIAFLGAVDLRRLRRRPLATWWGCGVALATVTAGSAAFHAVSGVDDPWERLLPAFTAAVALMWLAQAAAGVAAGSLESGAPARQVLARMNAVSPYRFPATFLGMGWFGAPLASLYLAEGFWPVLLLLGLLLYARAVCLKAWGQHGRLAELLERERRATAQLHELNRSKGQFVAVASHEVRTPLTAILGYVATLRRRPVEDPAQREQFLEIVERQARRLLGLVEILLTASKLDDGRLATHPEWVSVRQLCEEVVEGLGAEGAQVRLDLPAGLPPVHTDGRCLGQVLGNLLDNALKYSPPGAPCELGARLQGPGEAAGGVLGGSGRAPVGRRDGYGEPQMGAPVGWERGDGRRLVLWVRDRGVGIPQAEVDRIFDRFYQVDGSDSRPAAGIGLGLHLVRELVALLGGTVAVDTRAGHGSRFTVVLPLHHPDARAPDGHGAHPNRLPARSPGAS